MQQCIPLYLPTNVPLYTNIFHSSVSPSKYLSILLHIFFYICVFVHRVPISLHLSLKPTWQPELPDQVSRRCTCRARRELGEPILCHGPPHNDSPSLEGEVSIRLLMKTGHRGVLIENSITDLGDFREQR